MKVWIQSADFEAKEFDLAEDEAKKLFSTHDWAEESRRQAERQHAGEEFCPPGIGFVRPNGRILHVCPHGEISMVHFHRQKKILGLFWTSNRVLTAPEIPNTRVPDLIGHFYRGHYAKLEDIA